MFSKQLWIRHFVVAIPSVTLIASFWFRRMDWDPEMSLWRSIGDSSWVLLCISLLIGPLARLWQPVGRLIKWRREVGIWFGVLALGHALLIVNG